MKKLLIVLLVAFSAAIVLNGAGVLASEGVFHGGDVVYTKPVMGVIFSHKAHVEDQGMGCDMCHTALFDMQNLKAQENEDFTMQSLYDGKYCGACHTGAWAFASNTQCARCHIGVKGYNKMKGGGEPKKGH
jgi:c(7)-type cytochrome triheme protein